VHITIYFLLIIFFAYFYVSITFNPEERAEDMKKYGGFIPGIRPGRPTAEYLQFVRDSLEGLRPALAEDAVVVLVIGDVEADRGRRHATFLQRRAELASYRGLLSGHPLDSEKAHEAVGGGFGVDGHDDPLDRGLRSCEHRSRRTAWQGS